MSAWIQTYSGLAFDFEFPRLEQISIEDIAHAAAYLCRFVGHCERFYSVAEHSVHAADLLRMFGLDFARWGLMHDAHEPYVADLPSPLKRLLPDYRRFEKIAENAVRRKFGLVGEMPAVVKRIDLVLLASEAAALHRPPPRDWDLPERPLLGWSPQCWAPEVAEARFLETFAELFPEAA